MKTLEKKQGLITRAIADECMILNPEDGYMHLLNTTGKEIWELLDTCSTLENLVEAMYLRYDGDISREVLQDDINEILNSLKEHKLVMEQDNSSSGNN
jgi:hypothetical protein